jgi:ubiquinone/menaquinone biosynthesis C-methylase UbiE
MDPVYHREVYNLEDDYWWFKSKRYLLVRTLRDLANYFGQEIRLLDSGCGTGANLREISKFFPSVGVEKYFDGLLLCKNRSLNNVLNGQLERLPFKDESFDVVLAMDVLEHVDDDIEVLKELFRVSKKNGILITHVPAFMFLWSDHDIAVSHKRRYITEKFVKQLEKSNFKVKYINYRLCLFFILGILRKYLIKIKKIIKKDREIKSSRPKVGRIINYILYIIVKWEDRLLNYIHPPVGLSIFCIAQKKN